MLGIEPGASRDEIKVAWRKLARQHHPDLIGDDPEVAQRATRQMAEINTAYTALTRGGAARSPGARPAADAGTSPADGVAGRRRGPPSDPPARPVTGRVDTSRTFRSHNQTTTPPGTRLPLAGQPPFRSGRSHPELRASQPSGPTERDWDRDHPRREPPALDDALEIEVEFGKFHGHTLGQIAAFEPSYIDWLATVMTRDPDLAAAARVVVIELDRRGIRRAHRPMKPGWQSNPFL